MSCTSRDGRSRVSKRSFTAGSPGRAHRQNGSGEAAASHSRLHVRGSPAVVQATSLSSLRTDDGVPRGL